MAIIPAAEFTDCKCRVEYVGNLEQSFSLQRNKTRAQWMRHVRDICSIDGFHRSKREMRSLCPLPDPAFQGHQQPATLQRASNSITPFSLQILEVRMGPYIFCCKVERTLAILIFKAVTIPRPEPIGKICKRMLRVNSKMMLWGL